MKKNLVVVGYGGMGGWHVEHALKSDVVNLLGIYDIKEERSALARERGIYAYASLDEVLAGSRVDIVTVAIPNDDHEDTVIRSLLAGKNVICEKPVALSLASLDRMIEASKKSGKLFTTHQNRRWDVDFLAIKQIVASSEIGKPLRIESRIHGSRGIPSDWRGEKKHGGGMILDWGVHLIDQLLQIYREPIKQIYCTNTHITNQEVDDGFYLTITFESGAEAFCEVGTYNFLPLPRFYMKAEKGTALISDWREKAKVAVCRHWHENDILPVKTAAGLTKTMAPRDSVTMDTYEVERPASDVHDFYRNFCLAIDGKAEQLIRHDEMRRFTRVMELAFESDEKNAPIPFTI